MPGREPIVHAFARLNPALAWMEAHLFGADGSLAAGDARR